MAKKKEAVEIVVIMDRSGSMSSVRNEAIGGFNNFLANQQALPGAANLTVVQFDDQYEVPVDGVKLKDVKPFTEDDFVPRGMTAMNDAIGRALSQLLIKDPFYYGSGKIIVSDCHWHWPIVANKAKKAEGEKQ